jgi:hypothetical protein
LHGFESENRTQQLRAPRPDQPGDTQDLTATQHEARAPETLGRAELGQFEDRIPDRAPAPHECLLHAPPRHHADQVIGRDVHEAPGGHGRAVSEHAEGVGDSADFIQKVRNVQDGQTGSAELSQSSK